MQTLRVIVCDCIELWQNQRMAIFHFSMKTISRSAGRCATAAAAYRAAQKITHQSTGEIHDFRRKRGVLGCSLFLPACVNPGTSRDQLWNAAEESEKRKNSTVAREIVIALPAELDAQARQALAYRLAQELVERHQCAVDVALHAPGKEGDHRNFHAHLLMTTRRLGADGFAEKTRELDVKTSGEIEYWRSRWAQLANDALALVQSPERIDHRSNADRGIDTVPTVHMGPGVTAIERDRPGCSFVKSEQDAARAAIERARDSAKQSVYMGTDNRLSELEQAEAKARQVYTRLLAEEEAQQAALQASQAAVQSEESSWALMRSEQLAAEGARLWAAALDAEKNSKPTEQEIRAEQTLQAAQQSLKAVDKQYRDLQAEVQAWPDAPWYRRISGGLQKLQVQTQALGQQLGHLRDAADYAESQHTYWRGLRISDARAPFEKKVKQVESLRKTRRDQELKDFAELNAPLIQAQLRLMPKLTDNQARDRVMDAVEAGDERLQVLRDEVASFDRDGGLRIVPVETEPEEVSPVTNPKPQTPQPDDRNQPG